MKTFVIKVPIYDVLIHVRVGDKDLEPSTSGLAARVEDAYYLIRLRNSKKCPELYNSIAHEIMHVVWHILARAGMKLSKKTQEAYCYLTGYIHEQIYKNL